MKLFIRILFIIFCCLSCVSCGNTQSTIENKSTISTSIPPIKYLLERITENDFNINVIVPNGTSPETYSMTQRQAMELENSQMVFITGALELENQITKTATTKTSIINISNNIDFITGHHHHHHHDNSAHEQHLHGVDPHIWLSTAELSIMTQNICTAMMEQYPDSVKYMANSEKLLEELSRLHTNIKKQIEQANTEAFVIYHPALSYYAREFGLEQIAIEDEGKEPNVGKLNEVIKHAKSHKINKILYQNEFPADIAKIIAEDINAETVSINPLSDNILEEIQVITNVITSR